MKKLFLISAVFFFISRNDIAYAQEKDTSTYLDDSIGAKKANFINKPLSVLFKSLKIPITTYRAEIPFPYLPDTLTVSQASFSFSNPAQAITRMENKLPEYNMHVTFSAPQKIPKSYFKPGNVLDWTTGWTTAKANYLGQFVISNIW